MRSRVLLLLALCACKSELKPAQCPPGSANVDGICRSTCDGDDDCLFTEGCLNQVCLPRSPNEGPKVRLFEADRLVVTRSNPVVFFDYVVTNATMVDMVPMPGRLSEHAGTIQVTVNETTDFTLFGRSQGSEHSLMETVQLIDDPPPGELFVSLQAERFDPAPCDTVTVQWTIAGDFDPNALQARIEADGAVVFNTDKASGRAELDLDTARNLIMYAEAGEAAGRSLETKGQPAVLCSVTSWPQGPVAVGDTVLIEWETKGAAAVLINEVGGGRLYTHPVIDRTQKVVGRWLVVPPLGTQRYRITAELPGSAQGESIEIDLDAVGERPPPIVDTFTVSPEWFLTPTDLEINWDTRGGVDVTLNTGQMEQQLSGASGVTFLPVAQSTELFLSANRPQVSSAKRRFVWYTIEEVEPNDDRSTANPLQVPAQNGDEAVVARLGNFDLLVNENSDWYGIRSDAGALRVRLLDPRGIDCADLQGVHITVDVEQVTFADVYVSGSCPSFTVDAQQTSYFNISVSAPMMSPIPFIVPYVLAVDVGPFLCGDGNAESFEECDDGNKGDGDGCSSACVLEPGFSYQVAVGGGRRPPGGDAVPLDFIPYDIGSGNADSEGFAIVPASIHYFGNRYAGVMVHVNGMITLLPQLEAKYDVGLGSPAAPDAVIAGFGADLFMDGSSSVRHWVELSPQGQSYLFQYVAMHGTDPLGNVIGPITFTIEIDENGAVRLYYDEMNVFPDGFIWMGGIEDASSQYVFPIIACSEFCSGTPLDFVLTFDPF